MGDLAAPAAAQLGQNTQKAFAEAGGGDPSVHDETQAEFDAKVERHGVDGILRGDDEREELDEAAREREEERRSKMNDELRAKEEARGKATAAFGDASKGAGAQYEGSRLKDYISYGIKDSGSFYKFDNSKVTDKQLRRMIIRAYCEKDWKQLYFYDKKGKIDQQLTSRANVILSTFAGSKSPRLQEIAQNMSISTVSMSSVEPFRQGNPAAWVSKAMENAGRKWDAKKESWKNDGALGVMPAAKNLIS